MVKTLLLFFSQERLHQNRFSQFDVQVTRFCRADPGDVPVVQEGLQGRVPSFPLRDQYQGRPAGVQKGLRSRLHLWGNPADFNIINNELETAGYLVRGPVGAAPSMLIDAAGFLDTARARLAADPRYFLTGKE